MQRGGQILVNAAFITPPPLVDANGRRAIACENDRFLVRPETLPSSAGQVGQVSIKSETGRRFCHGSGSAVVNAGMGRDC